MSAIRKAKEEHLRAIGGRLTYAIGASKFSRAALARKSGVRVDAIGRLEKARRLPALGALKRLADVLRVPSGWLVFGEPPTPDIPHPRTGTGVVGTTSSGRMGNSIPIPAQRSSASSSPHSPLVTATGVRPDQSVAAYMPPQLCDITASLRIVERP